MKLTTIGGYCFYILLLIFAIIVNIYWSNFESNDSYSTFRISFILCGMCLGLILLTLSRLKFDFPINICLGWIMAVTMVYLANSSTLGDLISMVLWPLCFLCVYLLISDDPSILYGMKFIFIFIFFIGVYFFLEQWMNPKLIEGDEEQKRFNLVFFPLLTTPWILLLKNRWVKNFLFVGLFIIVILSQKRSAFIIMLMMLLPYIISEVKASQKKLLAIAFLSILISVLAVVFVIYSETNDNNIVERMNSISDDEGSGRLPIYLAVLAMQDRSSPLEYLFGHGHFSVRRDSPFFMSAHNDFLEILYDYGILVFVLYLLFWYYIIRTLIRLYREKSEYSISYFSSVVVFTFMSLVSHLVLYASNFIYLTCFWGAIEAIRYSDRREPENYR